MKIHSIAGFAIITNSPQKSANLYAKHLGLPLTKQEDYLFTDDMVGCNHFGICSLSMAAQFCFGVDTWPDTVPQPTATLEFEFNSPEEVAGAVGELRGSGQEFIHDVKVEPWGQTVARFISPEGLLIGLCYTPNLHGEVTDK